MKFYKILNPETGLFSRGGEDCDTNPKAWSKKGKTWNYPAHVRAHLRAYKKTRWKDSDIPEHWIVIEYSPLGNREFNAKIFYYGQ